MQNKVSNGIITALVVLISICACAYNTAPKGWLSGTGTSQKEAYGSWITVIQENSGSRDSLDGELIAILPDSIIILSGIEVITIPKDRIISAKITAYYSNAAALGVWGTIGILSTPAQGYFGIITMPLWLISAIASGSSQSFAPQKKFPKQNWNELFKFARFPQGLPAGFDRRLLNPKPRHQLG
jgi:hypothetical protein